VVEAVLVVIEEPVEKHVKHLRRSVDIAGTPADHRRGLAVLTLRGGQR
jgi:hypothetical protein